jgi:hypothetical protein
MLRAIDQIKIQTKKTYKPAPAPPTRKQISGWHVEQVGPKMWVVFRNSSTQGKQAVMDFPDPSWAESFAAGCNAEHKNPTKMSAQSLKRKDARYLTDAEKADLAALENGEGI